MINWFLSSVHFSICYFSWCVKCWKYKIFFWDMVDTKCENIFSTLEVDLSSKYLDTWKHIRWWIFISLISILYSLNWLCLKCLHAYRLRSVKFAYIKRENIYIHVNLQLIFLSLVCVSLFSPAYRHRILYPLRLELPFPNDARNLRPKASLKPNQISNWLEKC